MKFISQVTDLKLLFETETNYYYIIKILKDNSEIVIAKIGMPFGTIKPCILTLGDNLQTYIVSFEDYQHFIQLVDEAYYRFEI